MLDKRTCQFHAAKPLPGSPSTTSISLRAQHSSCRAASKTRSAKEARSSVAEPDGCHCCKHVVLCGHLHSQACEAACSQHLVRQSRAVRQQQLGKLHWDVMLEHHLASQLVLIV